jgi:CO dehydrogenase maturation factor
MKIAVSGKGGSGKTTLVAALARSFVDAGREVLAIDADPNSNLAIALGHPRPADAPDASGLIHTTDLIAERTGAGGPRGYGRFFKMNPRVDDIPDTCRLNASGVSFIVLGGVHYAGGGCYCPENVFLQSMLSHLILERNEVVIIDMEAGIEHIGRATVKGIDVLVVMTEPTLRSVETAKLIRRLASDLGVGRIAAVANKVAQALQRKFIEEALAGSPRRPGMEILGFLSLNEKLAEADISGEAVFADNPVLISEVDVIRKRIEGCH